MPSGLAYALLPHLRPGARPLGYPSLRALARRIHRDRAGHALQLRNATLSFQDRARPVIEVLAEDQASGSVRRIGFAWIAGADAFTGPQVLQAALSAEVPAAGVDR
ncbi:hypothetical protein [Phenylobacterium sp.]|uniref:hypothetical protein n=1 Tax=Phenylobacterium sp. TaxID=1871053 RepID=UPI00391A21DA